MSKVNENCILNTHLNFLRDSILTIPISPGILPGTQITFESAGDKSPHRFPSNVIFIVCDKPHPIYRRDCNDLLMDYKITLCQALLGFTMSFKTIDDRKISIQITDVVQ